MKNKHSRRTFIKNTALLTAAAGAGLSLGKGYAFPDNLFNPGSGDFTLPALPYAADALEPHIDKETMLIHHGRHHKGYVDNLNKALLDANISGVSLEALLKNVSKYNAAIRNNAGGHYNHSMFWKLMSPEGGGEPTGVIAEAINKSFGSFELMREKFNNAATSRFGSGWAWLVFSNGKLEIGSTPNQDNPLMDLSDFKGKPILALDVWEHAYYLKYQNKRSEYVNAFWNLVNWGEVNRLLR